MDAANANQTITSTPCQRWLGAGGFALLLAWQAWLTLGLFGPAYPWPHMYDDEPILSGAHPQHQYLGQIGAQTIRQSGWLCAYDPAFQAGYLKTPLFDGSRFAEVFYVAGGGAHGAAYKIGIAGLCMLVPILLIIAARGFGLDRGSAFLAAATGMLIWWGPQARAALEGGTAEILVGSLALLAHIGMLAQWGRSPCIVSWLGMFLTAALGWFAQPMLVPIALPLLLLYYLCVGVQHPRWSWHAALLAAEVGAVAVHLPWLIDWGSYWWLRLPLPTASELLPHRTLRTLWEAPLWSGPAQRALAVALLGSAVVGIIVLHGTRRRPTARLLLLGTAGMLSLAFLGISWEPLGQLGTTAFFAPALWFAALPAALAWTWLGGTLLRTTPGKAALAALLLAASAGVWLGRDFLAPVYTRAVATEPFKFGLGPERLAVVAQLIDATTQDARILWEDRPHGRTAPRWSALLPRMTDRHFLGGLDPDGLIEHSAISFLNQLLDGRHISTWTDQQLDEYCRRYNIGWVVGWTPATIKRFAQWDAVESSYSLSDDVAGRLFTLKRPDRSYALKGKANLIHADAQHITMADVEPDNDGVVVLSLHWQDGLRVVPNRVTIEREPCGHDPIGFIRLRTDTPVARVTLTWEPR